MIDKALASSLDSTFIPIDKACHYIEETFDPKEFGLSEDIRSFTIDESHKKYKLLGKGTFGFVFKTYFQSDTVALKIIQKAYNTNYSIGRELYRWLTFSKKYPSDTLEFLGCFHDRKQVYFLSNMMTGSLRKFAKERLIGKIDSINSGFYEILKRITEIVQHIHELKFVHHDIKPENFLYQELPERNTYDIRIIDFGFAESVENKRWFSGTAIFMPPEKFLFKEVGTFTDIYSLGVSFWDLLSGDVKIDRDCYTSRTFNTDSYADIVLKMQDFFQEKFNCPLLDDYHTFKESENLPDLIYNMMAFDHNDRPSAAMVVEKLNQFKDQLNKQLILDEKVYI